MLCPACNRTNDADATFCAECGRPIANEPAAKPFRSRRIYLFALFLVPVLIGVAALGYYRFFLPDGVVAVVNGEEIKNSELEGALILLRKTGHAGSGPRAASGEQGGKERAQLRYEALAQLIQERLLLQEARKAGVQVSGDETAAALTAMRVSSGMNETGFRAYAVARYGSAGALEQMIANSLMINKLLSGKAAAGASGPSAARSAVSAWFEGVSRRAVVRVSIAEQWSGAGCSCCAGGPGNRVRSVSAAGAGGPGPGPAGGTLTPEAERAATEAGLAYWRQKNGQAGVSTRLTDFGCHIQIDIVKDSRTVKSLRYQNGTITEM